MFEILKESSEMIENCIIWREKQKKKLVGEAVTPPILHSFILYLSKETTISNLRAVTLYLVEFLRL